MEYMKCDVTSWTQLRAAFDRLGQIDMLFANAGISEGESFLEDRFDSHGILLEPTYEVLDVNLRAVLNVVKLGYRAMKGRLEGGSIVITASSTAYAPELGLPVYSAVKSAVSCTEGRWTFLVPY